MTRQIIERNELFEQQELLEHQAARVLLESIGKELVLAGLTVNWSKGSGKPALIVNGVCLLRKSYLLAVGGVAAKFWHQENPQVKAKLAQVLGDRIDFANYCFYQGRPLIGESLR